MTQKYDISMNRKKRKLRYIRIKNSWRLSNINLKIPFTISFIDDLGYQTLTMDFKNRENIIKYGVKKIAMVGM